MTELTEMSFCFYCKSSLLAFTSFTISIALFAIISKYNVKNHLANRYNYQTQQTTAYEVKG